MSGKDKTDLKSFPRYETDVDADRFVSDEDLSEYDFSAFQPTRFEFSKKEARVNMRLPVAMLEAIKARAEARGMPYQRFIREVLERALAHDRS